MTSVTFSPINYDVKPVKTVEQQLDDLKKQFDDLQGHCKKLESQSEELKKEREKDLFARIDGQLVKICFVAMICVCIAIFIASVRSDKITSAATTMSAISVQNAVKLSVNNSTDILLNRMNDLSNKLNSTHNVQNEYALPDKKFIESALGISLFLLGIIVILQIVNIVMSEHKFCGRERDRANFWRKRYFAATRKHGSDDLGRYDSDSD